VTSAILVLIASVYLAIAIAVLGARRPTYNHARHTISELGEFGSPYQGVVSFGVFLPVGLALAAVAVMLRPTESMAATLAACIAVGYLVAAVFPCDRGSPMSGSFRQGLHNLGGGVEYFGGAYALLRLAETHGPQFRVAGIAVGASALLISAPTGVLRGAIQRVAEALLFGALIWYLVRLGAGA
jgi:hypothetical protein